MDETDAEFDERPCRVIAQAKTTFYPEDFVWKTLDQGRPPSGSALACVADAGIWHEFVPAQASDTSGRFRVVLFNFSENGRTGAIVICGKDRRNSAKLLEISQGAMDYWACPVGPPGERFVDVIRTLIQRGATLP